MDHLTERFNNGLPLRTTLGFVFIMLVKQNFDQHFFVRLTSKHKNDLSERGEPVRRLNERKHWLESEKTAQFSRLSFSESYSECECSNANLFYANMSPGYPNPESRISGLVYWSPNFRVSNSVTLLA